MRAAAKEKGPAVQAGDRHYVLLALVAVELFMSFSFLGYIHIEPLSLTFVYIPVLMAACLLGLKEAALVGAVFGLASMWKASAFYVGAGDAIFSPVMSGRPVASVLLSVGTRTLFGLLSGLLFRWARARRRPLPWVVAAAAVGRLIHTTLVYAAMGLLFPESGYGLASVWDDVTRWDFLPLTAIAGALVGGCYFFSQSAAVKKIFARAQEVDRLHAAMVARHKGGRAAMLAVLTLASFSVAIYFTNRIETVMRQYQIKLSDEITYDLMHLQIQFLMGILSLGLLVVLAIVLYQKNIDFLYYEARLDGLTGLLGRQQFFHVGAAILAANQERLRTSTRPGCFIILDVDHFKRINDSCGHPAGDQVLKEVARSLQQSFGPGNLFSRLGGDEFVALILEPLSRAEIAQALEGMKARLRALEFDGAPVTCSIGVIPVEAGYSLERMYRDADRLLYEAKKGGRDRCVFGYHYRDEKVE